MENITTLIKQAINKIENTNHRKSHLTGVPSGLTELDRITSGWQKSELIVIGARPGFGKTALALSIARNAVTDFGKSVAIFSLKETAIQLTTRLLSIESEISAYKLKKGVTDDFDLKLFNSKIKKLSKASLFIDDTPHILVSKIRIKILKLKEKQNIDLIIIENLHEIKDDLPIKRSRTQEILSITSALKALATEVNVPIIIFTQLKCSVEKNENYIPSTIDIPQYKGITRNASTIMFLHRDEYYGIEVDENGNSTKGVAELIIAQQDNEFCFDTVVKLKYEFMRCYFSDYKTNKETNKHSKKQKTKKV